MREGGELAVHLSHLFLPFNFKICVIGTFFNPFLARFSIKIKQLKPIEGIYLIY